MTSEPTKPNFTLFPDLSHRERCNELMDDFSCDETKLSAALENLATINTMVSPVKVLYRRHILRRIANSPHATFTLLDVGSGGGDLADWLSRQITALRKSATIYGIDHDARAVAFAQKKYALNTNLTFIHGSAFDIPRLLCEPVDFILCNHVLHHIEDSEIPAFLETINRFTKQGFLVCDLYRSYLSYYAFLFFSALFFRDSFSMVDGAISIRKGFTKKTFEPLLRLPHFSAIRQKHLLHAFIYLWR